MGRGGGGGSWAAGVEDKIIMNATEFWLHIMLKFYGPINPMGSCRANLTTPGQASSSKQLTNIVHILSPETDNCPS